MRRNEVLSLLERFPELVDGDDDELLHALISEAGPELPENEGERTKQQPKSCADGSESPAKRPR